MGQVITLKDLSSAAQHEVLEQIQAEGGIGEILIHPFSLGHDDEGVRAELEHMLCSQVGAVCGLPHPPEWYIQRNQEYQDRRREYMRRSGHLVTVLFEDYMKKKRTLEILPQEFPERSFVLVQTERGWVIPSAGWEETAQGLYRIGFRRIELFGALYSRNNDGRDRTGPCVNGAFRNLTDCGRFDEVRIVEEACYCS